MIEISHLKVMQGSKTLYKDLSLQAHQGEYWGIIGPNGTGKTTLLHTLAGLHVPKEGTITIHQQSLTRLSRQERAKTLGLLLQDSELCFHSTVLEAIQLAATRSLTPQRVIETLEATSLQDLSHRRLATLSGGEQQRVHIAMLLAQSPEIYLLDEPTNHLDLPHQQTILKHLKALSKTKTVIATLHDINQAWHYCTHILMLYRNMKWIAGPKEKVMTEDGLSSLYNIEVKKIQSGPHTCFVLQP